VKITAKDFQKYVETHAAEMAKWGIKYHDESHHQRAHVPMSPKFAATLAEHNKHVEALKAHDRDAHAAELAKAGGHTLGTAPKAKVSRAGGETGHPSTNPPGQALNLKKDWEFGARDKLAAYFGFDVHNSATADTLGLAASAKAGGYAFKKNYELIRAEARGEAHGGFSGSFNLFVLGQSKFSKQLTGGDHLVDKTWPIASPKYDQTFMVGPIPVRVAIEGKASFNFKLDIGPARANEPNVIALTATPHIWADANALANINAGSIGSAGVEGTFKIMDVTMPVKASVGLIRTNKGWAIGEGLEVDLQSRFLVGSITAWAKAGSLITNACKAGASVINTVASWFGRKKPVVHCPVLEYRHEIVKWNGFNADKVGLLKVGYPKAFREWQG